MSAPDSGTCRAIASRRARFGFSALIIVWFSSAAPLQVFAETNPYRIAVLELGIDDVSDQLARNLTEQLRSLLKAQSEYALRDTRVSLEQLSLAQDCDSTETSCLERIARGLDVDGIVFGRMTNESGAAVAKLQRYDVASRTIDGTAFATLALVDVKDSDVARKAQELVNDLFKLDAAHSPFARGLAADHAALPSAKPEAEPYFADEHGRTRRVVGYALLGGAVLSAGLSVLSFVEIDRAQTDGAFERYRRVVGQVRPSVHDVCDDAANGISYGLDATTFQRARNSCSTGRTFEVLQFIFIGSAVLSSGAAAYLLLGGETPQERPALGSGNFSLHPTVQKNGLGLGARFKF